MREMALARRSGPVLWMKVPGIAFLLICISLLGSGCASIITDGQETMLGWKYRDCVEDQKGACTWANEYLNHLGQQLAACGPQRRGAHYDFSIIEDEGLNAFCTPGGHIYITTGTIKICANASELAAILAHEIAHEALEHQKQVISSTVGLDLLNHLIWNDSQQTQRQLADLVNKGVMLRFCRSQEYEADDQAILMLWKVGYDPRGLPTFFGKLLSQFGSGSNFFEIYSEYPVTQERAVRARAVIAQLPPRGDLIQDTCEFRQFQSMITTENRLAHPSVGEGKK